MESRQKYLKIKDLLDVVSSVDDQRSKKLRALLDTSDVEKMQEFIARIEKENPRIERLN